MELQSTANFNLAFTKMFIERMITQNKGIGNVGSLFWTIPH
ncbi:hypothetical protein JMA_10370 [Jeotgalibacillus malaysiensis]|uniref:Uncharacterized protein n=1 Tax=Jeotgalibacillus malaysiensis TaxID=1508404 RepID=A0A0B5AQL4_9BACL|nr:hypothetical protein JMA_10370 [Jeotgalibacillus malaysiensis]